MSGRPRDREPITLWILTGLIAAALTLISLNAVAAPATVAVDWTAPTENVDGSPLTDLAGFKIYHGPTSRAYVDVIDIPDPLATTYSFTLDVTDGQQIFIAMTAYDDDGNESAYSNEIMRTMSIVDTVAPGNITIQITITISCPPGMTCQVN